MLNWFQVFGDDIKWKNTYPSSFFTYHLGKLRYISIQRVNVEIGAFETSEIRGGIDNGTANVFISNKNSCTILDACIEALTLIWKEADWPLSDITSIIEKFGEPVDFVVARERGKKTKLFIEHKLDSAAISLYPQGKKERRIFVMDAVNVPSFLFYYLFHHFKIDGKVITIESITKEIKHTIDLTDSSVKVEINPDFHTKEELEIWLDAHRPTTDIDASMKVQLAFIDI